MAYVLMQFVDLLFYNFLNDEVKDVLRKHFVADAANALVMFDIDGIYKAVNHCCIKKTYSRLDQTAYLDFAQAINKICSNYTLLAFSKPVYVHFDQDNVSYFFTGFFKEFEWGNPPHGIENLYDIDVSML